jgi:hypothetical protein
MVMPIGISSLPLGAGNQHSSQHNHAEWDTPEHNVKLSQPRHASRMTEAHG